MLTLLDHFKMPPVASLMLNDSYYKESDGMVHPELIVGLELEIEQFNRRSQMVQFTYETDGSLRNEGMGEITYPTKSKYIRSLLEEFFINHRVTSHNYTERCSTHVHMNVQDFTLDNLQVLGLTYQMIERLLFQFVGNDRKDNIFCVPWYESGVTANFINNISKLSKAALRGWMKYTALNLAPAQEKGTVEFRHLEGTCDVSRIIKWLNLIGCMALWAKKVSMADMSKIVLDMNTVSNYGEFLHDVFGEHTDVLFTKGYKDALAVGVIDTKLMLMVNNNSNTKVPLPTTRVPYNPFADEVEEVEHPEENTVDEESWERRDRIFREANEIRIRRAAGAAAPPPTLAGIDLSVASGTGTWLWDGQRLTERPAIISFDDPIISGDAA